MKTISRTSKPEKSAEARKGASWTYDAFKQFEGRWYTGMKVGRHHTCGRKRK